jgi:predicted RNA-binding Zn ribbon-like protein
VSELRIVGGDAALNLINTVEPRIAGRDPERDHLRSNDALLQWAERAALLDAEESAQVASAWADDPSAAAAELDAALLLRAALGTAIDAARARARLEDEAMKVVVRQAASALTRAELTPDPGGNQPARRYVGLEPARRISDRLALHALDLLLTADLSRLKACPPDHGGCGWVFLDTSKNGTRRWCSMEDCGAKAKSRRLTERRRTQRAVPDGARDSSALVGSDDRPAS